MRNLNFATAFEKAVCHDFAYKTGHRLGRRHKSEMIDAMYQIDHKNSDPFIRGYSDGYEGKSSLRRNLPVKKA
jgi:hypothetical protein